MPSYNVMYPIGMTPSAAELLQPTLTDVTSVVKTSSALQRHVSLVPSLQLILGTGKMCTYKVRRQSILTASLNSISCALLTQKKCTWQTKFSCCYSAEHNSSITMCGKMVERENDYLSMHRQGKSSHQSVKTSPSYIQPINYKFSMVKPSKVWDSFHWRLSNFTAPALHVYTQIKVEESQARAQ